MDAEVTDEVLSVANHWAGRIRIEFVHSDELQQVADLLVQGNVREVYETYAYLRTKSITRIPGKPIKLYFLKEMVIDLHRFFS